MPNKTKKQGIKKDLSDATASKRPKVPEWLDCAWRRVPCGKKDCPICSRISKTMANEGEGNQSAKKAPEFVSEDLIEVLSVIKEDARKKGIDISNIVKIKRPPRPYEFPLYHKVNKWRAGIYDIAKRSDETSSAWLNVEAGEDVLWYANTILAKVYRQLCNRWYIARGDDYGEFDYEYTKYVLDECFLILKNSLQKLVALDVVQKNEFSIALMFLNGLEDDVRRL